MYRMAESVWVENWINMVQDGRDPLKRERNRNCANLNLAGGIPMDGVVCFCDWMDMVLLWVRDGHFYC